MLVYEDHCIEVCQSCQPTYCKYLDVPKHICDKCGEQKTVYRWQGEEFCLDCIIEDLELEKID